MKEFDHKRYSGVGSWYSGKEIVSVAFTLNGELIITADVDNLVSVWDTVYEIKVRQFKAKKRINKYMLSPYDKYILAQGENGWTSVFKLEVIE